MMKRGLIIVGIIALLSGIFGCADRNPFMLDGPGMVNVPNEDMALFGTWTNDNQTVEIVVDGIPPYLIIKTNGEQTFEASVHVDIDNGNALDFGRDDGEITPVPYESVRIDLENNVIYGVRLAQSGDAIEEALHRVDEGK